MKHKTFALCAVICGFAIVFAVFHSRRPAGTPSDSSSQSPKPKVQSPATTIEALSQAVKTPTAPPQFAALTPTNQLFRTRAALWREPAPEEAFSRFKDWTQRYLATEPASRDGLVREGAELARVRRVALKELIRTSPERALELTVPSGIRAQLPVEVTSLLEEQLSARGKLEVLGVLAEPGRETELPPTLRTATIAGKEYKTFTYGERLGVPTRNNIALTGVAVDDVFALSENALRILDTDEAQAAASANPEPVCSISAQPALPTRQAVAAELAGEITFFCRPEHAAEANDKIVAADAGPPSPDSGDPQASAWTEGQKKLLVIRVDFPDVVGVSLTDSGAITLISNLNNFYSEMSFGRASFALNGGGSDFTPVFRMPQAGSYYGTNDYYNQLRTDARNAAAAAGYTLANYNLDVICFGAVSGWGWSGLGYIGASGSWLRNSFSTGVAGHELGHNYGLNHANYWDTAGASVTGPGSSIEYGDSFDTMGSASAGNNHFNARYKNYLNWLQAGEIVTATTNGTYRIACHDNPSSTGFRGLKVVKNSSTNYWVEFRQKFTSNKWLMSGAGLRWAQSGNQKSQLLDTTPGSSDGKNDSALVIGRTFSDWDSAIHITPVGKGGTTPESLDVVVNLGSFPGNHPPTVDIAASATNVATGGIVTFAATATDSDGDTLAYYWDFGDSNFGTNSPTAGKSWTTAGDYLVRCVVSDMKGGVATKWVIVRVGSPTTFRIAGNITDGAAPVQSVRVYASSTRMGYTDSDGNYAIVGLPAGAYAVNASLYGYTFALANFTNTVSVGPDQTGKDFLATVTSASPPSITTQPASLSVNPGASATFSVVAGGASPLSYQWRFNGVNISGATSSSYTKSNVQATNAGNYSVVVNNAYGTATSANAVLTVNTPPVITGQPQSQTVIAGDSATFTVTATGSTPLAYQWRRNGTNVAGATSSSYTRVNAQPADAGAFTVVVTNVLGAVTSSPAALTVNCTVVANATNGGAVTKSPDQTSYAPGSTVTLTASHPTFAFTGWTGSVSATTNPLVVVVTTNLNLTANFQSPVPDLIVDNLQAAIAGTWSTGTSAADKYSTDYRTSASVGGSATATATFTPNIATAGFYEVYVWTPTIPRGATATPVLISGLATNFTMNVNQSTSSGGWLLVASSVYFVQGTNGFARISNNAGQGGNKDVVADAVRWVYSAYQTLVPPVITAQPTNVTVVAGNAASFYASASGSPTLACQWRLNGNDLPGCTNGTLTLGSAQAGDAGDYCIVVANGAGCVTSLVATLTVLLPPQILVPPQSQRVVQGGPVTLSVSATGTEPLTFQWRVNAQAIPGATGQSLNLGSVQPSDAGDYDVVLSNPAGTEVSPAATLVVSVRPRLNSPQYWNYTAQFTLSGTPGDLYMVQFSTNLFEWSDVSTVSNQSGNVLFVAPQGAGEPLKFYRARLTE